MKVKTAVSLMTVLSTLSFGSFAAESISLDQSTGMQSIGSVSVSSSTASSPSDMHEAINQAADERGATAYRVIEARDGDTWHATAELYK